MNENKTSCAPADNQQTLWDSIDWTKAELSVRKLQARIVKAQKESKHNKVRKPCSGCLLTLFMLKHWL